MPDMVLDANGVEIKVGARVKPWTSEVHSVPGGVVTEVTEMDADYNDETGRPERHGPFVHVLYDDGTTERWDVDDRRDWYTDPAEWICDEIEVEV